MTAPKNSLDDFSVLSAEAPAGKKDRKEAVAAETSSRTKETVLASGPAAVQPRRRRVLVVDDDIAILLLVKKVLTQAGYDVETAESGMEGIARYRRTPPDLVLLDVQLPGETGFQVCARLKKVTREEMRKSLDDSRPDAAGEKAPPIVFLTGRNTAEDVMEAVHSGGDGFIVKPFDPGDLVGRVDSFLTAG